MVLIQFRGCPGNDVKFVETFSPLMLGVFLHLHRARLVEIETTILPEKV